MHTIFNIYFYMSMFVQCVSLYFYYIVTCNHDNENDEYSHVILMLWPFC